MVVDQVTKSVATVLGNTAVTHPATNAEFSLGLAGGSLSMMVLVTIAGIVAFGAYVLWQALRGRLPAWVPGLLLGGAASSLVDRLLFGAVRDFVPNPVGAVEPRRPGGAPRHRWLRLGPPTPKPTDHSSPRGGDSHMNKLRSTAIRAALVAAPLLFALVTTAPMGWR